ncbi:hypothetical protein PAESOLCIP111_04299 [Paenibacillus solanacearum]|uniref:Uncharacterized protein n=1 Tax=Paenibacillus solanacearum TaxID=2048548 RepID=A0A916NRG2_9BACL|nr:hypothetical protein [Paenibacillus solanacearum]CAG7642056.1 hypothetical protein PAESOLCIP111_04299 [Paenibacillus solanacearum]
MNTIMEYIAINIWIGLITILLWINDGTFSMLDRNIVFLLAITGMIRIRMEWKKSKQASGK